MNTATLTTAASVSYGANAALGLAVANRVIDTSSAKWIHHALYISTFALTGATVLSAIVGGDRRSASSAPGWILLPTLVPLAALSGVNARTPAHPLIALTAAPFYVAAAIVVAGRTRVPRSTRARKRGR